MRSPTITPEARKLAAKIVARRKLVGGPLTGQVRTGWRSHALADGYGVDGGWRSNAIGVPRAVASPLTSVEHQAGWLVWEIEQWGARHAVHRQPEVSRG